MQRDFFRIPWLLSKLLDYVISDQDKVHLKGDYEEIYDALCRSDGKPHALAWVTRQILVSAPILVLETITWWFIMIKNYLTVSFRSLLKNRGFSAINIAGLAFGMACCLFIMIWVSDELSYDRFHKNIDRLHHVQMKVNDTDGISGMTVTPAPLAKTLKSDFPEVLEAARFRYQRTMLVRHNDIAFYETELVIADASFFDIFSFPFKQGDAETALSEPNTIVISSSAASKYFGSENPVGKVLKLNNTIDCTVTGIFEDVPDNSSIKFDMVLPWSYMYKESWYDDNYWDSQFLNTYILLNESVDWKEFNSKISNVVGHHVENSRLEPVLYPIKDLHLDSTGNIIYLFTVLAGFVLLIALINYMNLSTARSSLRAKEIGLRKVVGAQKKNIIRQFYTESLLTAFIAMIIALVVMFLMMPKFNEISGKNLSLAESLFTTDLFAGLVMVTVLTGILGGSYPGHVLSSFQPVKVLKSSLSIGMRNPLFRKILVTLQFAMSISLVVGTFVVNGQLNYIKSMDMGYDRDHLLYINIPDEAFIHYDALKSELLQNTGIEGVTALQSLLTGFRNTSTNFDWDGKDPDLSVAVNFSGSDSDVIETLDIEMIEGRSFSGMVFNMSSPVIMINEAFKNVMGAEPVTGKSLVWGENTYLITGVMKDFQIKTVRQEINPAVVYLSPNRLRFIHIRVVPENLSSTLAHIEKTWKRILPAFPLDYKFFDERIDRLYRAEIRIGAILRYFTGLGLFIACLGLFGLASFTAQRRTREIGIRKVLGASETGIVMLLSSEFIRLVLLANLIGLPVAAWLGSKWLENFAYRYEISTSLYVATIISTLAIALTAVLHQAVRASRVNPAESLRSE